MKKTFLATALLLLGATAAQAEHKLLITDVLDKGQVEAQATYEYNHSIRDFTDRATGETGKLTINSQESFYSVGAGLGHGLEISASVPYLLKEREKAEFDTGATESGSREGFGDFALQAKYRLLGGHGEPTTLVAGLGLKFDTGSSAHAGTETTDVSPFIAVSRDLGHHLFPYAAYRATLRNHDAPDTHTVTVGVEKQFCPTFTLDAKVDASFNTSSDKRNANERYVFELGSYILLCRNLYLLPAVAYTLETGYTDKLDDVSFASQKGYRAGLALYYLY